MPMYTVSQVAKALGVTGTTVRTYAGEFAPFLSPSATPPPGKARQFSDDDLAILMTVGIMRGQLVPTDAIVAALEDGTRLERAPAPAPPVDITPAADAFTTTLQVFESRLDKAESRLEVEREARLAAELRAIAAETELRLLREASSTDTPMTFGQWWRSRRRP